MGDSDESRRRKRHKPIQPPSPSPENDRNARRTSQKKEQPQQRNSVFRRLGKPKENTTRQQSHKDRPEREICRHFKARGYCDYNGKCAFQHPPHLAVRRPAEKSSSSATTTSVRRYSPPLSSSISSQAPPPPSRKSAPMPNNKDFRRDNRDRSTTTTWRLNASNSSSSNCCTNSNAIPINTRNRRTNENLKSSTTISGNNSNFGQKSSLQNRPSLKIRRPTGAVSAQYHQQAIQKKRINRLTMRRTTTNNTNLTNTSSTARNSSSNNRRTTTTTMNLPKSYSSNNTLDRRRLVNTTRKSPPPLPPPLNNARRNVNYRSLTANMSTNEKSSNRAQPPRKRYRLNDNQPTTSDIRNRRSTIVNDRNSKFTSSSSSSKNKAFAQPPTAQNKRRDYDVGRRSETTVFSRRSPSDSRKTTAAMTTTKERNSPKKKSAAERDKSFSETKSLDTSVDSAKDQRKFKTDKDPNYRHRDQSASEKDRSKVRDDSKPKEREKSPRRTTTSSSTLKSLVSVPPPPAPKTPTTPKKDATTTRKKSPSSSSRKSSSIEKKSDATTTEKKKLFGDPKFQPPNKKSRIVVGGKSSTYKRGERTVRPTEKNRQATKMMEKIDKRKSEERKLEIKNKETTERSSSVSIEKKEKSPKKSPRIRKEIEISESCDLERSLESGEALSSERQDLEPISDEESQEAPPAAAITTENLRVDWSALVKEDKEMQESESISPEEIAGKESRPRALERFKLANFLPNLHLNKKFLGPELTEQVEKIVNDGKQEKDQWKIDNKLYNPTKLSVMNNIGRYRKALSARSELQIRRKLCGLYDEPPQHLLTNTSEMGVSFNAEVFNLAKKLMLEPEIAVT